MEMLYISIILMSIVVIIDFFRINELEDDIRGLKKRYNKLVKFDGKLTKKVKEKIK